VSFGCSRLRLCGTCVAFSGAGLRFCTTGVTFCRTGVRLGGARMSFGRARVCFGDTRISLSRARARFRTCRMSLCRCCVRIRGRSVLLCLRRLLFCSLCPIFSTLGMLRGGFSVFLCLPCRLRRALVALVRFRGSGGGAGAVKIARHRFTPVCSSHICIR
jgi:hypothetical protein